MPLLLNLSMQKRTWLFFLTLFLCLIAYVAYLEWASPYKRKQNFATTKGHILDVRSEMMDGSHAADINFEILINGKHITRTTRITCEKSNMVFELFNKQM